MIDVTYPGVYVNEPPMNDGVIIGAPTSVAAFVGRLPRGPVNQPVLQNSLASYQVQFDGLNRNSTVSYMVRDFYRNGGTDVVASRVFEPYFSTPAARRIASAVGDHLTAVGVAQTSGVAATAAAVTAAIAQAGYDTSLEQKAAARFEACLQTYAAAYPSADKAEIDAALIAAQKAATPQGTAEISVSVASGVAQAADAVVAAASDAAGGDATSVIRAAQAAVDAQDDGPAKVAAHSVLTALQSADGAVHAAAFAVPDAVEAALQITQDAKAQATDVTAYKAQAARVTQVQDAALVSTSTLQPVLQLMKSSPPAAYQALTQDLDEGASAMDVALLATAHLTQQLVALSPGVVTLMAKDPGTWGDRITVWVDHKGISSAAADQLSAAAGAVLLPSDFFNLSVTYVTPDGGTISEHFPGITVAETGGNLRIDHVLEQQSQLIALPKADDGSGILPPHPPEDGAKGAGRGGTDSLPLSPDVLIGDASQKTGIYALDAEAFNILCIPPDVRAPSQDCFGDTSTEVYEAAAAYCVNRRAMLILDPPTAWDAAAASRRYMDITLGDLGAYSEEEARSSVVYFPRLCATDPSLPSAHVVFPACGAIAGIWANTDATIGVWKAPAGLNAGISGVIGPSIHLSDNQNEVLNPEGINCIRSFPQSGTVVWGARTMLGADEFDDSYKYIPTRRLALYIENSILQGTQWAAWEANDEALWSRLRLQVGSFMRGLFALGAFAGVTATDAFAVICDATTTTPADQAQGIVNILVRFAPVAPAEFITLTLSIHSSAPEA